MRLAAILKQRFDVLATLEPGSGGVLDVFADDKLVFSKHQEHRFPDEDEIVELVEETLTPP